MAYRCSVFGTCSTECCWNDRSNRYSWRLLAMNKAEFQKHAIKYRSCCITNNNGIFVLSTYNINSKNVLLNTMWFYIKHKVQLLLHYILAVVLLIRLSIVLRMLFIWNLCFLETTIYHLNQSFSVTALYSIKCLRAKSHSFRNRN